MGQEQTAPQEPELDVEFKPEEVAAAVRAFDELCQQNKRRSLFGRRVTAPIQQHKVSSEAVSQVLGSLVQIGGAQ